MKKKLKMKTRNKNNKILKNNFGVLKRIKSKTLTMRNTRRSKRKSRGKILVLVLEEWEEWPLED
jgi:RNase P/RNase MRP subunit p30